MEKRVTARRVAEGGLPTAVERLVNDNQTENLTSQAQHIQEIDHQMSQVDRIGTMHY